MELRLTCINPSKYKTYTKEWIKGNLIQHMNTVYRIYAFENGIDIKSMVLVSSEHKPPWYKIGSQGWILITCTIYALRNSKKF